MLGAVLLRRGQEALKREAPRRQAGHAQRRDGGAGAGDGADRHARLRAQADQILAGVGDGRGSGVRHERARLARQNALDDARAACRLVVLIIADERLFQLQMVQQPQRHPRVLGRDKIRLRKHLAAALGDIGQIADRRRHKIEHRAHGQSPFA